MFLKAYSAENSVERWKLSDTDVLIRADRMVFSSIIDMHPCAVGFDQL